MSLSFTNKCRWLVNIAKVMLVKQLSAFWYRCNYIVVIAAIFASFQAKSQSEDSLIQLTLKGPQNKHDSIYYELFRINFTSDLSGAKHYAQLAFRFSSEYKHCLIQAKACRGLGILYDMANQVDSSRIYYHKGIQISSLHNFKDRLIDIYNDLGLLHERLDIYDSALHYFMLSYDLASQTNSYKDQAIASHNIGLVHSHLENYKEALFYIKQAIAIETNHGITEGINIDLTNLARILNEQGQYNDAIEQLKQIERNCKNGCDDNSLTGLNYGLGYAYLKKGNLPDSYTFFLKALALARKNDSKQWLANTLYHLSSFSINREAYSEAVEYLHEAEKISREISHRRLLRDVYNQLSTLYDKMGSTGKAFQYQKLYLQLKDSIFNVSVANNLKNIELNEQHKQSDKIIQNKDIAIKEKIEELWKSNFIAIVLVLNCIMAISIIYFAYRSLKKTKKYKTGLEEELVIMLEAHQINHREIYKQQMEFNYLLGRVSGFLNGPVNTIVGLSNLHKNNSTPEEDREYVNKMRSICITEILSVLNNIMKLCGVRNLGVSVEVFDIRLIVDLLRQEFKGNDRFTLLNFNIHKSVRNVLKTDQSQFVTLVKNTIQYFIRSEDLSPIEITFEQYDATTVVSIKNYADISPTIPQANLFDLFAAQVIALKLHGDTLLTEHDGYSLFKILIPTDYNTPRDKPIQKAVEELV